MTKVTNISGTITFHCRCQNITEGTPDDTLIEEGFLESSKSDLKHSVFIENSPHDPAGCRVKKDCPKCGLDFLTLIMVGTNENTMYTCDCGFTSTFQEYNVLIQQAKPSKD